MTEQEERLLNAIDAYADNALGSDRDGGELARQRALAIDAYAGKNIEPAPQGRSQVVDWTVFETIQWILPSITRIFAGGDNVVEFEAQGPDDEEAAQQESDYLNYKVQKNNWFLTVLTWCQDALLTKNAYCLVDMEEKLQPEKTRYEGISEEQVAAILDDDVEVVGQEIRQELTGRPQVDEQCQPVIDPATGQPVPEIKTLFDIEIKRTKAKKNLKFKVLAPENCIVADDTPDFTLQDCDYFEYHCRVTISELRKQGFDVPDDIADTDDYDGRVEFARDEILYSAHNDDNDTPDASMRKVTARHIWIRHDTDEDGVAELQHVLRVGQEILFTEEVNRIPVACIVPFVNTHRHIGSSVADLVFDIQRIKTALLRCGLDSLYLSVNPRHLVSDKVNLDDMLTSRPGGLVRLKSGAIPGEGHAMPLVTEFVFPQAQEGLRHMDSVTEARAGVSRLFQGIDESEINDHNRIGQLSSMAAQRVEQIARIFANGFERLFSLAHELILKSGHESETVKLRGQWVQIDPSNWNTGRDLKISAPFAAGNKDLLLSRLFMLAGSQEKALAGGLPIVTPDDAYELQLEIARAADLNGEKFWTDPRTIPPKEPPPDYNMLALQIEDKKAENDGREIDVDAEVDKYKADLDAEVKQFQARLNAEVQLALASVKGEQSVNLEAVRSRLKGEAEGTEQKIRSAEEVGQKVSETTQGISEIRELLTGALAQLGELQSEINSPREIVRDDKGRVTGVKIGNKVKKLKRDGSGRVVGV